MSPILSTINITERDEVNRVPQNNTVANYSNRNGIRQRILLRWQETKTPLVFFGYSLVLLGHFIGWVLFTVYATFCFFTQHSTTQRCKNFDYFSHPKALEVCWQVATGLNAIAYIVFVQKMRFADASSFSFKILFKIPTAIVPLLIKLCIAVAYETVMALHDENQSARAIEVGFIWRNTCVMAFVFFLNFTRPPRATMYKVVFYCTLLVFFLDQLVMAALMVGHVHYRVNALKKRNPFMEESDTSVKELLISMMTIIGVFSLHSSMLNFFWRKIFQSRSNLLQDGHI